MALAAVARTTGVSMIDLLFVVIMVVFFAAAIAYVGACRRIVDGEPDGATAGEADDPEAGQ
jgi:hypothetical protein